MEYRQFILNRLLDKYEKSSHFYGKSKVSRRVLFYFTSDQMPEYRAGDRPEVKEAVHYAVNDLEQRGLVEVEWVRGEKGNLLYRVSLNLQKVEEAYRLADRTPRHRELQEVAALLREAQEEMSTTWIHRFLQDCRNRVEEKFSVPSVLPRDFPRLHLLIKAFQGLEDKGDAEMLERIFSIRYLGDSKLFSQKIKSLLVRAIKSYCLEDLAASEEDALTEVGIVKTTEEILLAGPLMISLEGRPMDLSPLYFGTLIDTGLLEERSVDEESKNRKLEINSIYVDRVLLVENKTNFHHLARQGVSSSCLLLYLGGFPGPRKRFFLRELRCYFEENRPSAEFYHWGDLDVGGIRIFGMLKEKVLPNLKPLFMDTVTLEKHQRLAESLNSSDRKNLSRLLQQPLYREFYSVMQQMLDKNIKLEQEALLTDSFALFEQ